MLARALAPLFYARISPLLFKHVIATDASESGLGVCYVLSSGILPASTLDMLRHLLTYDWKVAVSYRWKWRSAGSFRTSQLLALCLFSIPTLKLCLVLRLRDAHLLVRSCVCSAALHRVSWLRVARSTWCTFHLQ
eukprot:g38717.t1